MIGFWSGFAWLVGMTAIIALLSEYIVGTIEVILFFINLLFRVFKNNAVIFKCYSKNKNNTN